MRNLKHFVKDLFFSLTRMLFSLKTALTKNITYSSGLKYFNNSISLQASSSIIIGSDVTLLNSNIVIDGNGSLHIGHSCVLKNLNIKIGENSSVSLGKGVIARFKKKNQGFFSVDTGSLVIDDFANLACNIFLRFKAQVSIGRYSSIGFDSAIVSDDFVSIGNYVLISNNVDIYDTNSHSVEFEKRRQRIESGYPTGCSEIERPDTSPIIIGDDVWIGKKSIILKGARIGNRCIVGMGSNVTKGQFPANNIIVNEKARSLPINK